MLVESISAFSRLLANCTGLPSGEDSMKFASHVKFVANVKFPKKKKNDGFGLASRTRAGGCISAFTFSAKIFSDN